jgi:hypothetical protein
MLEVDLNKMVVKPPVRSQSPHKMAVNPHVRSKPPQDGSQSIG